MKVCIMKYQARRLDSSCTYLRCIFRPSVSKTKNLSLALFTTPNTPITFSPSVRSTDCLCLPTVGVSLKDNSVSKTNLSLVLSTIVDYHIV